MSAKKFKDGYVSEFSSFLDGFKATHPEVVEDQRRGWYIYWDRRVDFAELEHTLKDNLPYTPYE
jgi:hypothetical protein